MKTAFQELYGGSGVIPRNNFVLTRERQRILKVPADGYGQTLSLPLDPTLIFHKIYIAAVLYNYSGTDPFARATVTLARRGEARGAVNYPLECDYNNSTTSVLWSAFARGTGSPSADMLMLNDATFGFTGLTPRRTVAIADEIRVTINQVKGADGITLALAVEQSNLPW